ncbi:neocarzinostatin apoprotein domain-containing protein [Streptomyces sp. NPDC059985]|uniref:neocarzinostatin apoprotein domain-containing protein n=1 Tax=Streptomyces sp. NPDC059985 TaxID=3347025 RepID=UPI0036B7F1EE
MSRTAGAKARPLLAAVLAALALALLPAAAPAVADEGKAAAALSLQEAAKGTEITVTGTGWRARTMVMLLVCGQNMIGGTNSCANADGAAVAVAADGSFTARLQVAAPPKPCPCVVNVASVNGDRSTVALPLRITDHESAPLPAESGTARLAILTGVRLQGEDGVLTWFGAPPGRRFTVTVGNLGSAPVKDPVFQLGTARGVFAPTWEEARWKGTIAPGGKAEIGLDVALPAGAHGDHTVSLKYGDTVLAAQPWGVDRPYGVLLFWGLLLVVVPTALFRVGMAVVDRIRPPATTPGGGRHRGAKALDAATAVTARLPRIPAARGSAPAAPQTPTAVLPWFTPEEQVPARDAPAEQPQTSAPTDQSPTTKGHS